MVIFFIVVGVWLIGWGILLSMLLLRALLMPPDPSPPASSRRRGDALTLLDTTEIEL